MTGIQDPYEEPINPEVILDTESQIPEQSAENILEALGELAYVRNVRIRV